MESENEMCIKSKGIFRNKEIIEKQIELNKLIEEYNIVISNKGVYINRNDILREIFLTVNNRIEIDCFITDKMDNKRKKGEEGCCILF